MALKTIRIINVKLKTVKIRTGFQYTGYFNYTENVNWAAHSLRPGHMRPTGCGLDIAVLDLLTQMQGNTSDRKGQTARTENICLRK